jgi:hypothetical protein
MESKFHFFLTGSRFFGKCGSGADFDFFVEDSPEVRSFLEANGFKPVAYYPGSIVGKCHEVYRSGKIDVQCVLDAEKKNQAQLMLLQVYPNGEFNRLP